MLTTCEMVLSIVTHFKNFLNAANYEVMSVLSYLCASE